MKVGKDFTRILLDNMILIAKRQMPFIGSGWQPMDLFPVCNCTDYG